MICDGMQAEYSCHMNLFFSRFAYFGVMQTTQAHEAIFASLTFLRQRWRYHAYPVAALFVRTSPPASLLVCTAFTPIPCLYAPDAIGIFHYPGNGRQRKTLAKPTQSTHEALSDPSRRVSDVALHFALTVLFSNSIHLLNSLMYPIVVTVLYDTFRENLRFQPGG